MGTKTGYFSDVHGNLGPAQALTADSGSGHSLPNVEAQRGAAVRDASLSKSLPELCGTAEGGQTVLLQAQRLDLWSPVQTEDSSQVLRGVLFEPLGRLMRSSAISSNLY